MISYDCWCGVVCSTRAAMCFALAEAKEAEKALSLGVNDIWLMVWGCVQHQGGYVLCSSWSQRSSMSSVSGCEWQCIIVDVWWCGVAFSTRAAMCVDCIIIGVWLIVLTCAALICWGRASRTSCILCMFLCGIYNCWGAIDSVELCAAPQHLHASPAEGEQVTMCVAACVR